MRAGLLPRKNVRYFFFVSLISMCWGLPGYHGLLALSFSLFYVICEFHYSYTEDEPS